jgi:hypothetical protein
MPALRLAAWPQEPHELAYRAGVQPHLFDACPALGVELRRAQGLDLAFQPIEVVTDASSPASNGNVPPLRDRHHPTAQGAKAEY